MSAGHERSTAVEVHIPDVDDGRGDSQPDLMVIGAHGGAGVTTLGMLLQPAWDAGAINKGLELGYPAVRANGRPLVVVARNTVAAAWHTTRAVTAIDLARGDGDGHIAALAIVADGAGPEPRDATARFTLLRDRVCGVVRIPFIPALRLVDDPTVKARDALEYVLDLAYGQPCH